MRFLLDQDVYALTVRFLRDLGHDVLPAAEAGLSQSDDLELIRYASKEDRLLVTRDRDFGALVFSGVAIASVIYLRTTPRTLDSVHTELAKALEEHGEDELRRAFVVVEPGQHRFRRLPERGDGESD